jgi:PAS domain S-box-containing protein
MHRSGNGNEVNERLTGLQDEIRKSLARLIRASRLRQQMTQQQLAANIGVSLRYLQGLEKGAVDPKLSLLETLAESFGMELAGFLRSIVDSDGADLEPVNRHYHSESLDHAIQVCDRNGQIIYVNRAWETLTGYDHREVVGRLHIWDFMPDNPDDRAGLLEYLAFLVKNQPKPTPYLNEHRRKNGRIFEIKIMWNYIFDRDRNVVGFVSSCYEN